MRLFVTHLDPRGLTVGPILPGPRDLCKFPGPVPGTPTACEDPGPINVEPGSR